MSESFWKKEIHLRRKKRSKAPVKAGAAEPVTNEPVLTAAEPKSRSFWKKEIHLRRTKRSKPAAESVPVGPVLVEPVPAERALTEPVATVSAPKSQSFWKKEIRLFRRKSKTSSGPSPEARAARVVSAYRVTAPPVASDHPAHLPEFAAPLALAPTETPPQPAVEPAAALVPDVSSLLDPTELELPAPTEVEPPATVEPAPPVAVEDPSAPADEAPVPWSGLVAHAEAPADPSVEQASETSPWSAMVLPVDAPVASVEESAWPRSFAAEPSVESVDPPAASVETVWTFGDVDASAGPTELRPFASGPAEPPAGLEDGPPPSSLAAVVPAAESALPEPPVADDAYAASVEPDLDEPAETPEWATDAAPATPAVLGQIVPAEPPALAEPTLVEEEETSREQPESPEEAAKATSGKTTRKHGGHATTRVVGLRIGSTQLAAAHVANNGKAELVQLAHAPLERGLVIGGEVRDTDGLTRELRQFFAANKLPRKGIRLGIASNRIGVRLLDVPTVDDDKQFENAIRFRAQELLPIPVTDAILDHVRLGETEGETGESLTSVLLVFAHRELVGRYVDACRNAGLRLSGIDLEAFALLRALAAPRDETQDPDHAVVAVAVGHDRTVLAVSDGRVCSLTRVLEWGSAQLDVAIARALDLTPSQAEPIKLELSLAGSEPPEGISLIQLEAVQAAVKAEIGVVGRELVSSLRFYQSRPDSLAIGEVLLSGGGSQLDGFADELQVQLGAPVRQGDPFRRVEASRKVALPERAGSFAIAVGLGIED
jgi:type IV pilus assembly protein PilM